MENAFKISWGIFAVALIFSLAAYFGAPHVLPTALLIIGPGAMFIDLALAHASARARPHMRVTQFRSVALVGTIAAKAVGYFLILAHASGYNFDLLKVVGVLTGLLIICAGNYLPKSARDDSARLPQPWSLLFSLPWNLPLSYLFGVRTWWTLSSDFVWNRTHRFTGRLWMLGGLIYVLAPWFLANPLPTPALLPVLVADWSAMVSLPILYSFWISRGGPHGVVA